jgi:thymidylate kinase
MKIAIVGTHGTGKSTLSYLLASHYKKQGKNVKIIQEVARTCPFPINHGMTIDAAKWIYFEHARKELESIAKHEIVIGDRSVYDSFVYARYFNLCDDYLFDLNMIAYEHLSSYDKIIFVRPDIPLHTDGTRSTDIEFQSGVDEIYSNVLENIDCIEVKSSQIFDPEESWKQYCL